MTQGLSTWNKSCLWSRKTWCKRIRRWLKSCVKDSVSGVVRQENFWIRVTCFLFLFYFWHAWLLSIPISEFISLAVTTPNSKVIFCSLNQTQSETSKSWSIETKPLFYLCFCLSRFYVSYLLFTIPEIQSSRTQFQLSDFELLVKKLNFLSLKQSLFSA